jgi:hypothetical protein
MYLHSIFNRSDGEQAGSAFHALVQFTHRLDLLDQFKDF